MTEKPRFSITVDNDLLERIDTYQHENRISNRNQAITKLIEMGYDVMLDEMGESAKLAHLIQYARELKQDEIDIIDGYRAASAPVRKIILDAARDALKKTNTGKSSNSVNEVA